MFLNSLLSPKSKDRPRTMFSQPNAGGNNNLVTTSKDMFGNKDNNNTNNEDAKNNAAASLWDKQKEMQS